MEGGVLVGWRAGHAARGDRGHRVCRCATELLVSATGAGLVCVCVCVGGDEEGGVRKENDPRCSFRLPTVRRSTGAPCTTEKNESSDNCGSYFIGIARLFGHFDGKN